MLAPQGPLGGEGHSTVKLPSPKSSFFTPKKPPALLPKNPNQKHSPEGLPQLQRLKQKPEEEG